MHHPIHHTQDQPVSSENNVPVIDAPHHPNRNFQRGRIFRSGGYVLILLFGIIYALTLDTGLQPQELHGGDLITHQYAQVQARPSNAPGYPLYTMGGWLWFHGWHAVFELIGQSHPNPMPILSSYSTIWALAALWLLYGIIGAILGQLVDKRHSAWQTTIFCFLLTSFFGVTYFFWYYATTTEQYSSAVAQTLAIIYLYLRWEQEPARRSRLYWLAFLCGLALAHMLTVAFIVPPLVAIVLWRDPSLLRSPRAILTAIAAAALPLTSYIYVYLRGALNPQWWGNGYWDTPQAWFWSFISTAQGRDELAWAFEPGRSFFGNGFPELIWQELSLPLLTLGLVGIARLPRRHAFLLYATLLIYTIFCWLYRFGNWFQVILPAYPLILLGLIPLYATFQHQRRTAQIGRTLVQLALVASIGWRVSASLPEANSRHRPQDTALDHAARLLDQPLPNDARLFAVVDDALALGYLTEIWGIRPDISTIDRRDADNNLKSGNSIFATVDATPTLLDELSSPFVLDGFSPDWIKFSPPNALQTPPIVSSSVQSFSPYTVTADLTLLDYTAQPSPRGLPLHPPAEPALDVRLTWQLATGTWPAEVASSLRPTYQGQVQINPDSGQPIQSDRPRPLNGLWLDAPSTSSHETSEANATPVQLHDTYRLPQPAALSHPADGLLLILYSQTENGFVNLAEIHLPLPTP